ncbi:hypothetical protein Tco_0837187 [Tanacetum coccineum]
MLREVVASTKDSQKKLSEELGRLRPFIKSWGFKDVEDYNPNTERIFDEATEAFYKLEFPYISPLVEKAGQSPGSLVAMDPPTIQEAVSIIPRVFKSFATSIKLLIIFSGVRIYL